MTIRIPLHRQIFSSQTTVLLSSGALTVTAWKYASGIEAISLENSRGHLIVLPYQGQMIWSAVFDDRKLTMENFFTEPQPSRDILGTYGCFMFHAGLLRNGCPTPEDTHPLHGEMPCAPMDSAWLEFDDTDGDAKITLTGEYHYIAGFGDHYRAHPSVTLRAGSALFDIGLSVRNLSGKPMDLMYMAHMNYAYVPQGRFVEPLGIGEIAVRTSVPAHVHPTEQWKGYMARLSKNPRSLTRLETPEFFEPEIVSFLRDPGVDEKGFAHFFLEHPEGTAFYTRYAPREFSHATRWILHDPNYHVAGFVLPATCDPEGYLAEKAKGNVRQLAPQEEAHFSVQTGLLNAREYQIHLNAIR
ncbi:aldose 1-epimerase family protein [Kozakia baliensis]|uniref:aldose 1-epimerase family protein n=1 Tax=Kozakia baliensis TaxID=153496 RepID=UPI00345B68E9